MPNQSALTLRAVKDLIREPYAWPGGYPKFLIMSDSSCLCHKCAKSEWRDIARFTINAFKTGWEAAAVDINWESELWCDNCNQQIESAYDPIVAE